MTSGHIRRGTRLGLGLVVALLVGLLATPRADAALSPRIDPPRAVDAPQGAPGGVLNPNVWCSSYAVEPQVTWTLTRLSTGRTRTFRWTGALPGIYFPRVAVGRYRSHTEAWCRGSRVVRTHDVRVRQKTAAGTISYQEFSRIRRGMSRARVARLVGFDGRDCFSWAGATSCRYDMMAFWAWATVTYRDGRVVRKDWDVGHD